MRAEVFLPQRHVVVTTECCGAWHRGFVLRVNTTPNANEGEKQGPISSAAGAAESKGLRHRGHTPRAAYSCSAFVLGGFVGLWGFFALSLLHLTSASGKTNKLSRFI